MSFGTRVRAYLSSWRRREPQPIGGPGPRGFVGGLWHEIGELQFRFLIERGLRPEHVLLDIACGSLRAGVRLVPYLNAGNYLGIDIEPALIEHGRENELGQTLCAIKQPQFVVSGTFEFQRFSKRPDFAIAQSLFTHLTADDILLCLRNLRPCAKENTVLYTTFFEARTHETNLPRSHPHAAFRYTREEMHQLGEQTGWQVDYIGNWNHPRNQMMLRFTLIMPGDRAP